jgi:hypothetical protein
MKMGTYRIVGKLLVFSFLSFCLWAFSGKAFSGKAMVPQQERAAVPMKVRGLYDEQGQLAVDLQCNKAYLVTLGTIDKFSCTIKNNSTKNIAAANVRYSVIVEQNGKRSKEERSETIDSMFARSSDGGSKAIQRGATQVAGIPGPMSFEGMVLRMYVQVDYVQFDDGTGLGANQEAAQKIQQTRKGADLYRRWLAEKYSQNGVSIVAISSLLNQDHPIPETMASDPNQRMGAEAFRKRLLKLLASEGEEAVAKQLEKPLDK